jgi:hypothetical protein
MKNSEAPVKNISIRSKYRSIDISRKGKSSPNIMNFKRPKKQQSHLKLPTRIENGKICRA